MNVEKILFLIVNVNDNEVPVEGLNAAKAHWSIFYPELEKIIDQFIVAPSQLTQEQETILFYGVFLCAELKYTAALTKCLSLFSQTDTHLSPLDIVFGDTLTELTSTLFYNIAQGETHTLSHYITSEHEAMYCKAAAIEAIFAQFEMKEITQSVLEQHINLWLNSLVLNPNTCNRFLLSALASYCIDYQLDQFKNHFINWAGEEHFDEEYLSLTELKSWHSQTANKLIESELIQAQFNVAETFIAWSEVHDSEEKNEPNIEVADELGSDIDIAELMAENGLLSNLLFDEQTIIENSVPVNELPKTGRNDPCICGSGKKYKKCCLQ